MDTTDAILKLVRTFMGLPRDDQNRLLRLIDMLSMAPLAAQQRGHELLRELIDSNPQSKLECVDGIEELIEYLERSVANADDHSPSWSDLPRLIARSTIQ